MSADQPQPGDPVAVILARMEVKLDNALADLAKHSNTLDRHDRTIVEFGNRLTSLETAATSAAATAARSFAAWPGWAAAGISMLGLIAVLAKELYS